MNQHNHNLKKEEKDKKLYQCPECGLYYEEKKWAEQCEAWCKETQSCNLDIIKYTV